MAALLGLVVLVASIASFASAPDPSVAKGFKRCGKVDVGHTDASVRARNVKCRQARRVIRGFVRKFPGAESQKCVLRSCRVGRRFRCILGGGGGIVRLGCTNPRRHDADIHARWGD